MSSEQRLCLIVNPRSAGGATARRLDEIRRSADRVFSSWELLLTDGPGHATALATQAVDDGFDVVAAVGGDGTASETVNGLFDGRRLRRDDVVFTVIPAGTGSDLVKTLVVPRDIDQALLVARDGETRASDVLHVSYTDHDGDKAGRICINVAGFGANGEVVRRVNAGSKRLGGTLTFLGATLGTIGSYQAPPLTFSWTDAQSEEHSWSGDLLAAFVANGAYCGGGMWVGRGGSMQDGLVDVILVPNLPKRRLAVALPRLFTGKMDGVPGILRVAARTLEASSNGKNPVLIDVDGEQPGRLPMSATVLGKVLRIRGKW